MASQPKIYLITGCSSGLGYSLALAALKAGHKVIATSRNPARTPNKIQEITTLGGQWATLDVASPSLEAQLTNNILPLCPDGKIDVLINNAGIADASVVEDLDLERSRAVFETNFWGLLRLTRVLVPIMRTRGTGTIVNISSTNAVAPFPLLSVYSASKAAVDMFTIALQGEVAPFGVRVLLVTPSGIRTPFNEKNAKGDERDMLKTEYKGTPTEYVLGQMVDPNNFKIDPGKAASTIVAAVDGSGVFEGKENDFLRLPLGADSLGLMEGRITELKGCAERFPVVAKSVDLEE